MVSNAMQHGQGAIMLQAERHNGNIELHVLDEGEGFPLEFLPHAFERFTRADSSQSRGSVGLGLSIVQVIAEAHGGQIRVDSELGRGSTFSVELPLTPRGVPPLAVSGSDGDAAVRPAGGVR